MNRKTNKNLPINAKAKKYSYKEENIKYKQRNYKRRKK